jgi:hypothetical protein
LSRLSLLDVLRRYAEASLLRCQVSKSLFALTAILTVVLTAAGGCGATKDLGVANDAVTRFHGQLDSQDFATIYS